MTREKKPRKPFEHKMDSDPEFLSSMQFVKAVLRQQFMEWEQQDKEARRIKAEQNAAFEAARLAAEEQERKELIELERRVKRQVMLEEKQAKQKLKDKAKQTLQTAKQKNKVMRQSMQQCSSAPSTRTKGAFVKDYGSLTNDTGVVVRVTNLCNFLREHGYQVRDTKSLKDVLEGRRYSFKGWTLVGGPVEGMSRADIYKYIGWVSRYCKSTDDSSKCGCRVTINQNR